MSDAVAELDLEAPNEFAQDECAPDGDATLMMSPDEGGIADFLSAPQDTDDQTIMIPPGGDEAEAEEESPASNDDDDLSNFLGMFK